ncbi:MAG: hypothetical protein QNJ31_06300 [Candidatus Caenarcaniphilales bacterium]|nr:hypothetical protein [Candidatus Caenarcaniphilales bacterium]
MEISTIQKYIRNANYQSALAEITVQRRGLTLQKRDSGGLTYHKNQVEITTLDLNCYELMAYIGKVLNSVDAKVKNLFAQKAFKILNSLKDIREKTIKETSELIQKLPLESIEGLTPEEYINLIISLTKEPTKADTFVKQRKHQSYSFIQFLENDGIKEFFTNNNEWDQIKNEERILNLLSIALILPNNSEESSYNIGSSIGKLFEVFCIRSSWGDSFEIIFQGSSEPLKGPIEKYLRRLLQNLKNFEWQTYGDNLPMYTSGLIKNELFRIPTILESFNEYYDALPDLKRNIFSYYIKLQEDKTTYK